MPEYIISSSQLVFIKNQVVSETPYDTISEKWEKLTEEEKKESLKIERVCRITERK